MLEPKADCTERTLTHTERTLSRIESQLELAIADLKIIKNAFPEDEFGNIDTIGHRRYHEEMIGAAKAQTAFWTGLRQEMIRKGLLWGLIVVVGLIGTGLMVKTGITWGTPK